MNALRAAASAAADTTTLLRRAAGESTVAVGGLVARLAVSVSGAIASGEFAASPAPTAAGAAAAAAAAAAEEDEYAAAVAAGAAADDDERAGARVPRFLVPAHGAVVVFIGGGPVGLWAAASLKLLRPLWRVVVAERHATYLRSHVLRVDAASFANAVAHPEARAFAARLLGGRTRVAVRTTELEAALRALACALGVDVAAGEPVRALPLAQAGGGAWLDAAPAAPAPPAEGAARAAPPARAPPLAAAAAAARHSAALHAALAAASAVVAADGARSPARRALLGVGGGSGLREAASLAHMLHVRFSVAGGAARALPALQAAALFNAMGFVGEEAVGRARGAGAALATPVTLTLVVDDAAALGGLLRGGSGGGGAAAPLADAPLAPRLRTAVALWLNARAELAGDRRVPGSETVAAVNLSVYVADRFVTYASRVAAARGLAPCEADAPAEAGAPATVDSPPPASPRAAALAPPSDVAFALVGDAAFGVPFYRSLNNGLVCASDLAAALSLHGDAAGNAWRVGAGGSAPLEAYARGVERLASQETAAARMRARAFLAASAAARGAHELSEARGLALRAGTMVFSLERLERWRAAPLAREGGGE
jgi:hypothetical protein